jgi:hypothetical protein
MATVLPGNNLVTAAAHPTGEKTLIKGAIVGSVLVAAVGTFLIVRPKKGRRK